MHIFISILNLVMVAVWAGLGVATFIGGGSDLSHHATMTVLHVVVAALFLILAELKEK